MRLGQGGDGADARSGKTFGFGSGLTVVDVRDPRRRLLEVGPVIAFATRYDTLIAILASNHERDRLRVPNRYQLRHHAQDFQDQAPEDHLVGLEVLLEADVEVGLV